MYKVIIRHRPEYNTPLQIQQADNLDEANDTREEIEQQFGQALILTNEEIELLKEILNR